MKAVVITHFGGPEVLEIQDVPTPQPGPEELLVRQGRTYALVSEVRHRTSKPL